MKRIIYFSYLALLCLFANGVMAQQLKQATISQIQALLNEKATRTPAQQKMASQLLQGIRESKGQRMAAGVNLEPAKLTKTNGFVEVDITGNAGSELQAAIKAAGGTILYAPEKFNKIRARVALSSVETIAANAAVRFIEPAAQAHIAGSGNPQGAKNNLKSTLATGTKKTIPSTSRVAVAERQRRVKEAVQKYLEEHNDYNPLVLQSGAINSQGDRSHRADDVRNTYGYAGQGIKIGVLSDSYNALGGAAADVANGELPGTGNPFGNTTPVTIVSDIAGETDEGRAMLQIIHDIAPKAQLFYATAYGSEASFADNIIALRNTYGCDIIIDDIAYSNEPVFQDGIIAQAVNTVTAAGALYFSAAANSGSVALGTAGVWEGDFNDAGSPAFPGATRSGTIHNFGSASPIGDIISGDGSYEYNLKWSDPVGASTNDYDLFLVDAAGNVKVSSTTIQNGTQDPYEYINPYELVTGDRLVVFKTASAAVRAIHLNANRGRLQVATSGQTYGHSAAVAAYSVAAVAATGIPFVSTNTVESFSSDGLRRIFYNANGTAITPGNVLFSTNGGTVRNKPDITAADGVLTTLPSTSGLNPFYGTSAAAPHAGAIAALIKSARPSITPTQIRTYLTSTALDIQTPGYDNVSGYGIIQAFQAMQLLNPTPAAYINIGTTSFSEGTYSNGNGAVEPGEVANLVLQLRNSTTMGATNVSATITTNTPGVTITRGTASYGSIGGSSTASNTSQPFTFAINSSVACGTTITFLIKVNFSGGAGTSGYTSTITLGLTTLANIATTLGNTPPTGANYTVTSGQQTGRIGRVTNGIPSTCAAPIGNPGLAATTGSRQYDAYRFTNTTSSSQCYQVTMTSSNIANLYSAAYNSSGFVPSNPSTNYIAESDQSTPTRVYSFTVAAGSAFTVVIHDVNVTPASNSAYTLNVSYTNCVTRPACTAISLLPASLPNGATGTAYSQRFTASGGSGSYSYSLIGNLPAGLTLAGDLLSGTPTQAGSFAITVMANDLTGCPSTSASYTLVIAGTAPASVAATAGTPQSSGSNTAFSTNLQARVLDASNAPLSGVNVMFTVPTTGATGTFANGSNTATVVTNASGVATAPTFTANGTLGSYTVTAAVNGVSAVANFSLTNVCPSTIVTTNADSGPGSLRAILANSCPNPTITFSPGITSIALTSGELPLTQSVTINGPGADVLSISGSNLSRIFNMTAGTVSISGLTIKDGNPQDGSRTSNSDNGGGGILVTAGNLTLTNCMVQDNHAVLTNYQEGGGLDNEGATVSITGCSFINNESGVDGGAISNWGTSMTITNTTITGNTSTGNVPYTVKGRGGGIFSYTSLMLINSTVYGNTGYQYGGNIFKADGTITVGNTLIGKGALTMSGATNANGFDYYGELSSAGYNLLQTTGGATISGTTTGNQLDVNPKLLPLADYGGTTPVLLPMSNSPAINTGNTALTSGTDQRGNSRYVGGRADIGAVETNYAGATSAGTPQSASINTRFTTALRTTVRESGNLIAGDTVLFTAPATGASGNFANNTKTATVVTNASGQATAPAFTANGTAGTYNVTASLGSAFTNLNFALTNNTILPVTFGNMSASATNCSVQLQWETLTESNTKDFTIEYSTDGVRYTVLGSQPASGNSTQPKQYSYTHAAPAQGTLYYRIRQTDVNGTSIYGKVLKVVNNCGKLFIVYPNPVKDQLTIQLSGTAVQTVNIFNAHGQLMTRVKGSAGIYNVGVANWAPGTYTLSLIDNDKVVSSVQVVKE